MSDFLSLSIISEREQAVKGEGGEVCKNQPQREGSAAGGTFRDSVDDAGEGHAALLHMHVQPYPVAPDIAAGVLIDPAVLGLGAALVIEGTAARLHAEEIARGASSITAS